MIGPAIIADLDKLPRVANVVIVVLCAAACSGPPADLPGQPTESRAARVDPDYADVVIPPNIAPLNFTIQEPGDSYWVLVQAPKGRSVHVSSSTARITIPEGAWHRLLDANREGDLKTHILVRGKDGKWRRFPPMTQHVSGDSIDEFLVYTLLRPLFSERVGMRLEQRHLGSFETRPILQNKYASGACVGCHAFSRNRSDLMSVQSHDERGSNMHVLRRGEITTVATAASIEALAATYTSWHPDGQHVALIVNRDSLSANAEDDPDGGYDLAVYSAVDNTLSSTPDISDASRVEAWPEWSSDGHFLYFVSTEVLHVDGIQRLHHDLMRVRFDVENHAWGDAEKLLSMAGVGQTLTELKVSPDGRWLVFTVAESGGFPIVPSSADLYVMDLRDHTCRRLEINSEQADSWHCWSSNGRWLVFSSKRRDGLFARPYFSYVDGSGRFHKPLLLPQEDSSFYDTFIQTFSMPLFVEGPVEVSQRDLARAIASPSRKPIDFPSLALIWRAIQREFPRR